MSFERGLLNIYRIIDSFPKDQRYHFIDQAKQFISSTTPYILMARVVKAFPDNLQNEFHSQIIQIARDYSKEGKSCEKLEKDFPFLDTISFVEDNKKADNVPQNGISFLFVAQPEQTEMGVSRQNDPSMVQPARTPILENSGNKKSLA